MKIIGPASTPPRGALNPDEAAEYLGLTGQVKHPKRLIMSLARQKKIPSRKVGRMVVFPIAGLDKYLSAKKQAR